MSEALCFLCFAADLWTNACRGARLSAHRVVSSSSPSTKQRCSSCEKKKNGCSRCKFCRKPQRFQWCRSCTSLSMCRWVGTTGIQTSENLSSWTWLRSGRFFPQIYDSRDSSRFSKWKVRSAVTYVAIDPGGQWSKQCSPLSFIDRQSTSLPWRRGICVLADAFR